MIGPGETIGARTATLLLWLCLIVATGGCATARQGEVGRAPTRVTMRVEIDAPLEKVWSEFARIGDIANNSPTVSKSRLSSEQAEGIGATRHMEMAIQDGATLDERVTKWDAPGYMALEVYQITGLSGLHTMGGDFALERRGERTLLTSTLHYSMTRPFYGFMNRMLMKRKFARLWASVLAGYKKHIETGENVTADTELDLAAVSRVSLTID